MNQYQPGLHKLIYHPAHIEKIRRGEPVAPLHVSVWPTPRCQCKCSYCAFSAENLEEQTLELDSVQLLDALHAMQQFGLQAVEFSGGGEPTLWLALSEVASELHRRGLHTSLITNGYSMDSVATAALNSFDWIRISIHSMQHLTDLADRAAFWVAANISASYMVSEAVDVSDLQQVMDYCEKKLIVLRVGAVQPASPELVHRIYELVEPPTFFTYKPFGSPRACFMPWIRAGITWRGEFIPCPGKQLTPESEHCIPKNFALCHIRDIAKWLSANRPCDIGYRCSICSCGKEINDYLSDICSGLLPEDSYFV